MLSYQWYVWGERGKPDGSHVRWSFIKAILSSKLWLCLRLYLEDIIKMCEGVMFGLKKVRKEKTNSSLFFEPLTLRSPVRMKKWGTLLEEVVTEESYVCGTLMTKQNYSNQKLNLRKKWGPFSCGRWHAVTSNVETLNTWRESFVQKVSWIIASYKYVIVIQM